MVVFSYIIPFAVTALVFAQQNEEMLEGQNQTNMKPVTLMLNNNCRNRRYPRSQINRLAVPQHMVPWNVSWERYCPPFFTAVIVNRDKDSDSGMPEKDFVAQWNDVDNGINRKSFCGKYDIVDSLPINPIGRTGLRGQGILGRWGPNHWVHLIITRHRRDAFNKIFISRFSNKPILEMVALRGFDKTNWAVPGKILFSGESLTDVARRTYYKSIGLVYSGQEKEKELQGRERINRFFEHGKILYQGYVDDQRNTDNAWVETTVLHYHDKTGDVVANMPLLNTGNVMVKWIRVTTRTQWISRHFCFICNLMKPLLSADLL